MYKLFPGFDATPEPLILLKQQKLNHDSKSHENTVPHAPTQKRRSRPHYLERLRRGLDNDLDRRPLPGEPELRGETDLRMVINNSIVT